MSVRNQWGKLRKLEFPIESSLCGWAADGWTSGCSFPPQAPLYHEIDNKNLFWKEEVSRFISRTCGFILGLFVFFHFVNEWGNSTHPWIKGFGRQFETDMFSFEMVLASRACFAVITNHTWQLASAIHTIGTEVLVWMSIFKGQFDGHSMSS